MCSREQCLPSGFIWLRLSTLPTLLQPGSFFPAVGTPVDQVEDITAAMTSSANFHLWATGKKNKNEAEKEELVNKWEIYNTEDCMRCLFQSCDPKPEVNGSDWQQHWNNV